MLFLDGVLCTFGDDLEGEEYESDFFLDPPEDLPLLLLPLLLLEEPERFTVPLDFEPERVELPERFTVPLELDPDREELPERFTVPLELEPERVELPEEGFTVLLLDDERVLLPLCKVGLRLTASCEDLLVFVLIGSV